MTPEETLNERAYKYLDGMKLPSELIEGLQLYTSTIINSAFLAGEESGKEQAVDSIDMRWTADIPYPQHEIDSFLKEARTS